MCICSWTSRWKKHMHVWLLNQKEESFNKHETSFTCFEIFIYLLWNIVIVGGHNCGSKVKWCEVQTFTDWIAHVGMEKECHALGPQIAIPIAFAIHGVNLWICVQVTNPLDIHYNQFVSRTFKCEVAECLCQTKKSFLIVKWNNFLN